MSHLYPYELQLPAGWSARPGGFAQGDLRGDLFTAAVPGVDVNVLSEALPSALSQNQLEYVRLTRDALGKGGYTDVAEAGTMPVATVTAALLTFTDYGRPEQTTRVTQAVWVQGGRGWVATLVQPAGAPDQTGQFREMLASFRAR